MLEGIDINQKMERGILTQRCNSGFENFKGDECWKFRRILSPKLSP
jgi:hypothetical protein